MSKPRSLGVIVARGGSKRVPRKVVKPLAGHPLIAYAVRAAINSSLDQVVVSSEDPEIRETAARYGADVPFARPDHLATDFVRNDLVLLHALDAVSAVEEGAAPFDVLVLIQPTAPFIEPTDIDNCIDLLWNSDANCVFAGHPVREPPHWMFVPASTDGYVDRLFEGRLAGEQQHMQKLEKMVIPAGAIWAVRPDVLRRHEAIYVPPYRCHELPLERAVDLDEEIDFVVAEALAERHRFQLWGERASLDGVEAGVP